MNRNGMTILLSLRVYSILVLIDSCIFILACSQAWPVVVGSRDIFGLAYHFPAIYWFGLSTLILLFILVLLDSQCYSKVVYLVILLVFVLYLFGPPVFMMEEPIHPFAYYPTSEVNLILDQGHFGDKGGYSLTTYRAWPAIHLISASSISVSALQLTTILKYGPFFWAVLATLFSFALGNHLKLGEKKTLIYTLLVLLSTWGFWASYLPQGIAFLIFILAVRYFFSTQNNISNILVFLLLLSAITITHALTGLVLVLCTVLVAGYKRQWSLVVLCVIIYSIWLIYYATEAFSGGIISITNSPFSDFQFLTGRIQGGNPSVPRLIGRYSQLLFGLTYGLTLVTCLFFTLKQKNVYIHRKTLLVCVLSITGITAITIVNYSGETIWRSFWFLSIPASLVIVLCLNLRVVIISLAILLIFLHIPSHYGGYVGFEQVLTTELRGNEFLVTRLKPSMNDSYFYTYWDGLIDYFDPIQVNTPHERFSWEWSPDSWKDLSKLKTFTYVIISKQGTALMEFSERKDRFKYWMETEGWKTSCLVYSSGSYDIYRNFIIKE